MTPDPSTWAMLSNNLVYSAIAVYALAMLAYAAEVAAPVAARRTGRRHWLGARSARAERELVSAGGGPDAAAHETDFSGGPSTAGEATRGHRLGAVGTSLAVLGCVLNVAAVAARGAAAGRAPWGNMYEFAVTGAAAVAVAYLAVLARRQVRALGVWVLALVLVMLGLAVAVLYTPTDDLVPVLNSYWLVIHVAAAITSGGVFTVGAVVSVAFLFRSRRERKRPVSGAAADTPGLLPTAATLNQIAHAVHVFAFPVWTFAVLAGAIWAENAWGRYWGWDPKETWAFITWVLYAAYLHAQATAGWRGVKATWFALAGYLAFVFNFFGVNMWISGLHSYAGV